MSGIQIIPFLFSENHYLVDTAHVISQDFKLKTIISNIDFDVSYSYDPSRKQYNSTQILKGLLALNGDNPGKILGITDVDLFIPILTYIFGQAILFANIWLVPYGAGVWLVFHYFVVQLEEPDLRRSFGSLYADYVALVPRWFPRIAPPPKKA